MIKLDNGAVCTCDTESGCAYHGTGPAGVYRKSFEHASENYNAEKARANQLDVSVEIQKEKYNKLAHHIYATFPQHKDEGPWGAIACAARQIKDAQDLKAEVESLRRKLEAARTVIRALVVMAED